MGYSMTQDEFYQMIPDWISKDRSRWNHITLMAYFCHKYEQKNNVKFRLVRWKDDPGKGKESRDFAKLFSTFSPEGYDSLHSVDKAEVRQQVIGKIYNYINWMFDYKFRSGDKSVTGTNLFLMPTMINEFERMYATFLSKNKSKDSFESLISWAKQEHPDVFDRHQLEDETDLRILYKYIQMYNIVKSSPEAAIVDRAIKIGVISNEIG